MLGSNLSALQDSIKKRNKKRWHMLPFSFWRTNALNPEVWSRAPSAELENITAFYCEKFTAFYRWKQHVSATYYKAVFHTV